ncbi:OmpA family protein [Pararhodobacter marinus]|nr:OmpA family protein [Pararhodobacter marinus]
MAASGGDNGAVEEVTETVTEDSVRRSDETFEEARERRRARRAERRAQEQAGSQGDGTAGQQVRDREDDDDGIPDFLTGAVVGAAGALIVGSLLDDNREVVSTSDDRVVVRDQYGDLQVLRDDDAILRQPGSEVTTRRYQDGSSETIVQQPDGSQVVTVRNPEGRVVKRVVIAADGRRTVLFDDTVSVAAVDVSTLPEPNRTAAPQVDPGNEDALRAALLSETRLDRNFSLNQVRQIDRVRYLAPAVQVENITFETGSSAITPSEARELLALGELMTGLIEDNPNEVFLIEGHTDAVGSDVSNLTLSDRRAESVARALTEYFGVSPANMVLQGYGESDLRIQTESAERENRRVVVRRITPLLQSAQLQ